MRARHKDVGVASMKHAWCMNQVNDAGNYSDRSVTGCWYSSGLQVESISEATASDLLAAGQQRFQHASILNHKQTLPSFHKPDPSRTEKVIHAKCKLKGAEVHLVTAENWELEGQQTAWLWAERKIPVALWVHEISTITSIICTDVDTTIATSFYGHVKTGMFCWSPQLVQFLKLKMW